PGEGTTNLNVCNISLAVPSSLGSDCGDLSVHHAYTIPQTLNTPHKTVTGAATDTANPNMKSARPAGALCTGNTYNVTEEVEGEAIKDEKGGRASGSVTPSLNDDGGDEDICHTYILPKPTQPVPCHISPCPE
ncbi:hypothetical protein PAXRUDRAFT_162406, partial [Paxillus rubicundulus Ve08.2h10]